MAVLVAIEPARAGVPVAAIDAYVSAQMREQRIPGLALAVLRHGQLVYTRGYGMASLELDAVVRPQTRFQIGTLGKQFTAIAVMKLAEDRLVDLDAPIARYLPEVPETWHGVTLRRMLNHQSGIPQVLGDQRNLLDLRRDYSDEEYLSIAASVPLDFEPGTDASYSDTAYVLLGIVIGRVSGEFYGDFLQQHVFGPLGMTRTRVLSDADIIVGRANGYELDAQGQLRNQSFVSATLNRTADGSLYSTVVDLARWDAALYTSQLVPSSTLARMWQVDRHANGDEPLYHYGYGWEINQLRDQKVIEYDGNWQGFQAAMARYPQRELTVVVLTNRALCRAQALLHAVAGLVDPALAPYREARSDREPALTGQFRALLAAAGAGNSAVKPAGLSPVRWRALSRDLREVGALRRLEFAEEATGASGRRRVYRAEFEQMVEYYTAQYTQDGEILGLELWREY
jgi:CubicO group peptidase (beta-lactamase class C family)